MGMFMITGRLRSAAQALIDDLHRRFPGEELYCPLMRELEAALNELREIDQIDNDGEISNVESRQRS